MKTKKPKSPRRSRFRTKREATAHRMFMTRSSSNYRAMEKRVQPQPLPFTMAELREKVRSVLGTPCLYCQEPVREKTFSIDHSVPLSRQGSIALDNLDIVCMSCNKAKGGMTSEEFSGMMTLLHTYPDRVRGEVVGRLKAGASVLRLHFLKKG